MQFSKISLFSFVYAAFLLAPAAANQIPRNHLARYERQELVLRQNVPLINLNLNKIVDGLLTNVSETLTKASVVGTLVKSVATQLQASLTNIANSLKAENLNTDAIKELKTSVETVALGVNQLAMAIRDLVENDVMDTLVIGTVGKETATILASLLKDIDTALKSIDATLEESELKEVLTPLKNLTEPLEEIKSGLESLLKTLPSTVTKALKNLESSVQSIVTDVL